MTLPHLLETYRDNYGLTACKLPFWVFYTPVMQPLHSAADLYALIKQHDNEFSHFLPEDHPPIIRNNRDKWVWFISHPTPDTCELLALRMNAQNAVMPSASHRFSLNSAPAPRPYDIPASQVTIESASLPAIFRISDFIHLGAAVLFEQALGAVQFTRITRCVLTLADLHDAYQKTLSQLLPENHYFMLDPEPALQPTAPLSPAQILRFHSKAIFAATQTMVDTKQLLPTQRDLAFIRGKTHLTLAHLSLFQRELALYQTEKQEHFFKLTWPRIKATLKQNFPAQQWKTYYTFTHSEQEHFLWNIFLHLIDRPGRSFDVPPFYALFQEEPDVLGRFRDCIAEHKDWGTLQRHELEFFDSFSLEQKQTYVIPFLLEALIKHYAQCLENDSSSAEMLAQCQASLSTLATLTSSEEKLDVLMRTLQQVGIVPGIAYQKEFKTPAKTDKTSRKARSNTPGPPFIPLAPEAAHLKEIAVFLKKVHSLPAERSLQRISYGINPANPAKMSGQLYEYRMKEAESKLLNAFILYLETLLPPFRETSTLFLETIALFSLQTQYAFWRFLAPPPEADPSIDRLPTLVSESGNTTSANLKQYAETLRSFFKKKQAKWLQPILAEDFSKALLKQLNDLIQQYEANAFRPQMLSYTLDETPMDKLLFRAKEKYLSDLTFFKNITQKFNESAFSRFFSFNAEDGTFRLIPAHGARFDEEGTPFICRYSMFQAILRSAKDLSYEHPRQSGLKALFKPGRGRGTLKALLDAAKSLKSPDIEIIECDGLLENIRLREEPLIHAKLAEILERSAQTHYQQHLVFLGVLTNLAMLAQTLLREGKITTDADVERLFGETLFLDTTIAPHDIVINFDFSRKLSPRINALFRYFHTKEWSTYTDALIRSLTALAERFPIFTLETPENQPPCMTELCPIVSLFSHLNLDQLGKRELIDGPLIVGQAPEVLVHAGAGAGAGSGSGTAATSLDPYAHGKKPLETYRAHRLTSYTNRLRIHADLLNGLLHMVEITERDLRTLSYVPEPSQCCLLFGSGAGSSMADQKAQLDSRMRHHLARIGELIQTYNDIALHINRFRQEEKARPEISPIALIRITAPYSKDDLQRLGQQIKGHLSPPGLGHPAAVTSFQHRRTGVTLAKRALELT